jgi:hypothetical protein
LSFIKDEVFTIPKDKKAELLAALKGMFDTFHVPTIETIMGIYNIDIIRELGKRLAPIPPELIDSGLDYLIPKLQEIRKD